MVTQFRLTASHLGPQAPNYSTAWQSGLCSFTYTYKWGNLFLSEGSKPPAAVRADQGQWQIADKVSQQHTWLSGLSDMQQDKHHLLCCRTHHLSADRCVSVLGPEGQSWRGSGHQKERRTKPSTSSKKTLWFMNPSLHTANTPGDIKSLTKQQTWTIWDAGAPIAETVLLPAGMPNTSLGKQYLPQ